VRFAIRRLSSGVDGDLSLTREEFEEISSSQSLLLRTLAIEQRYDILVGNYADVELQLLTCALQHLVHPSQQRSDFDKATTSIDRVLMNFLSSARGYIEQVKSGALSSDLDVINKQLSQAYNGALAFRVMEALRNYTQHSGLPTHVLVYRGAWENLDSPENKKRQENVIPALRTDVLRQDKAFKVTTLKELELLGQDSHPLMPFVREYLSCLSSFHMRMREVYYERQQNWLAKIWDAALRYAKYDDNSLVSGVVAVALRDNGSVQSQIELASGIRDRLEILQNANRVLQNLQYCQITT
jgi:hypothetical protein